MANKMALLSGMKLSVFQDLYALISSTLPGISLLAL